MKILYSDCRSGQKDLVDGEFVVATNLDELTVVANAINEALEVIDDWEFETRTGATPARARELQTQIRDILRASPPST